MSKSDALNVWIRMEDSFKNRTLFKLAYFSKKIHSKKLCRYFISLIDIKTTI